MKSRNIRVTTALVTFGLLVALAGLIAPSAFGATKYELKFVTQPQDAEAGATITSAELVAGNSFVQVKLVEVGSEVPVTSSKALVTFKLATGTISPGITAAAGTLIAPPQPLQDGVATFGAGTLKILDKNEPQFTSYALVPITSKKPLITGPASLPFDIWEDVEACDGGAVGGLDNACKASLRAGEDDYTLAAAGTLGVSELTGALPGLSCPGQDEIFSNTVFSYVTTGSSTPVFLENHISKEAWQASANNGQAHADWCIGLLSNAPWVQNGAASELLDTNGPSVAGGFLWVALAPRCPATNPSGSAPCIVSQTGDGIGGSTTLGWLTAGDPPRKT